MAQAYLNQKKLDAEAKQLHNNALQFSKQTQQWLSLVDNFNSALKEIGDVENWAKVIEEDMRLISAALETAYEGSMNENSAIAAREENWSVNQMVWRKVHFSFQLLQSSG